MHRYTLAQWQHQHQFGFDNRKNERRTLYVVILTLSMMVLEIGGGLLFGSMALLADGWHMGTHAGALGIALFAYVYARRHANDPRYTFGTGKVSVLGGFSSAIVLLIIALLMGYESIQRLFSPQVIRFDESILVAVLGLAVNLFSAFLLQGHHDHHTHNAHAHDDHQHEYEHTHEHNSHQDHNLRAAYLHVLADALTSILAIAALISGKAFGWIWMDAVMGLVGAAVITRWSLGLLGDTSQILLDAHPIDKVKARIKECIESDADNRICDLHVWWVGPDQYAASISLVTHYPQPVEYYKSLVSTCDELVHLTVEVNIARGEPCIALVTAKG